MSPEDTTQIYTLKPSKSITKFVKFALPPRRGDHGTQGAAGIDNNSIVSPPEGVSRDFFRGWFQAVRGH
jgi:hypothetical protein